MIQAITSTNINTSSESQINRSSRLDGQRTKQQRLGGHGVIEYSKEGREEAEAHLNHGDQEEPTTGTVVAC